jgi:Ca2+-binding RTX toxin-like protein
MPIASEVVTLAGSGLVFENTYDASVTDGYRSAILTAETYLQSHFSNPVTIHATFDFEALDSSFAVASNVGFIIHLTYDRFTAALRGAATTADDLTSVAGLPIADPSDGAGFSIPTSEARALGFNVSPSAFDVEVHLSSSLIWSYGSDAVAAILHELTEGGFGRIGSLGIRGPRWAPMDLFRFTSGGARDYTGGSDGTATFFGIDAAHVSALQFHNTLDLAGVSDHEDLADWTSTIDDPFGPGGPGSGNLVSATDLQVLDVLGCTPSVGPPLFTSGGDDFASALSDTSHPIGQLAVGGVAHGALQGFGDRDWFSVQLAPGNYLISMTGLGGGGGTLADPFLRVYDATGSLARQADDVIPGQNLDARLIIHIGIGGTFYLEAGANLDFGAGSYTVSVLASAPAATAGADMLFGDFGGATLAGGAGDDLIVGRDAQNYLRGDDGNDSIQGGAAFDDINGNMGNDTAHGGEGDDWVVGGKGDDVLFGDDGGDIVYGNLGNDTCDGGWNNDLIRGGQGDDSLSGGQGDDWLSGDRGNDTMSGGSGADTFHTFNGAGLDVVTDFNAAEGDRVQLDPGTTYSLRQAGADTVIDLGAGEQMVLKNVQLASLPVGWIFGA